MNTLNYTAIFIIKGPNYLLFMIFRTANQEHPSNPQTAQDNSKIFFNCDI